MTAPGQQWPAGDPVPEILRAWLAPGKRTVSACLRITGRAMVGNSASCHQVPNRAWWKPGELARRLTCHLAALPAGKGEPIIIGVDDTTRRHRDPRIAARGICRDPVRSSHGHFATASGLRRLGFMARAIALAAGHQGVADPDPAGTALRWADAEGRRHKPLTERARQAMPVMLRRLPDRSVIFARTAASEPVSLPIPSAGEPP